MTSTVIPVDTPQGPGRMFLDPAEQPNSILLLGHGASGGIAAVDLELLAHNLPAIGTSVVRFEQPWRTAGRKVGAPPPKLDEAWCAALDWLVGQEWAQHQLLVGGRSAGARVACRTASHTQPAAIVCLAFPLHLPGRPEKSRVGELLAPTVPRLVLQGNKDSFGTPEEIRTAIDDAPGISVVELPGADHGFRIVGARSAASASNRSQTTKSPPLSPADLRTTVIAEVSRFIGAVAGISTS
ncbi:MAG TPA: alpha/beta family hydrolase [Propionibacteriaceae bacterium]